MTSREVLAELVRVYPSPSRFWAQKVVNLSEPMIADILRKIDPNFISDEAIRFAVRMLRFNSMQIAEVVLA
jgi:hypothetical protein